MSLQARQADGLSGRNRDKHAVLSELVANADGYLRSRRRSQRREVCAFDCDTGISSTGTASGTVDLHHSAGIGVVLHQRPVWDGVDLPLHEVQSSKGLVRGLSRTNSVHEFEMHPRPAADHLRSEGGRVNV